MGETRLARPTAGGMVARKSYGACKLIEQGRYMKHQHCPPLETNLAKKWENSM
jgi:hypothetical protein